MAKWKYGAVNKNVIDIQAFLNVFVCVCSCVCWLFANIGKTYSPQDSARIEIINFESEYICRHVDRLLL